MFALESLIEQAAARSEKSGRARDSAALALRLYQAHRFLDSGGGRAYLQKANHAALSAHRRNPARMDVYCLSVYIAIEAGYFDSANEMLDRAFAYRSFFKANEPFYHAALCFLYALLEICQRRTRSAKKHWRALAAAADAQPGNADYATMLGILHLESGEHRKAFAMFGYARSLGCGSVLLFEGMFRCLRESDGGDGDPGIFALETLAYAARRGAAVGMVADRHAGSVLAACEANPRLAQDFYRASGHAPALGPVCRRLMQDGDIGENAFWFYREAEHRQVAVPELGKWLVYSSFENSARRVGRYTMAQFLSRPQEMGRNLSVYIFHKLLTDPKLADLAAGQASRILKLGPMCVGMGTPESLCVLHYFWKRCKALGIAGADVEAAEAALSENITLFLLEAGDDISCVYVTEPETKAMTYAQIDPETGRALVSAVGRHTSYATICQGRRLSLSSSLDVRPMVETADIELYRYFFAKGDRRLHLLCYISNHYLGLQEIPAEAAEALEAAAADRGISKPYRNRILATLGKLHYRARDFGRALASYSQIDYETLDDEFVPSVLEIYLKTNESARAAALIFRKAEHVPDGALFSALEALVEEAEKIGGPDERAKLAYACYGLLLKGYYSDGLFGLVLACFDGSLAEWTALADAFEEDNRGSPLLDERALEMALGMADFGRGAQRAFARLCRGGAKRELTDGFLKLAAYEMLAKGTRPEYDTLALLESRCLQGGADRLLLWGLAGCFARHGIATLGSRAVTEMALASMQAAGVLLPVFKEAAGPASPYVEKHAALLHRARPGMDCYAYYRVGEAKTYHRKKMAYAGFGLYAAAVPLFYGESLCYYFSEETKSGSVATAPTETRNKKPFLHDAKDGGDAFFEINNAAIYEHMFKHERVEEIVARLTKDTVPVRPGLM